MNLNLKKKKDFDNAFECHRVDVLISLSNAGTISAQVYFFFHLER